MLRVLDEATLSSGDDGDGEASVSLTTVELRCGALRGRLCGALCQLLRTLGHPVVGDRFARAREE